MSGSQEAESAGRRLQAALDEKRRVVEGLRQSIRQRTAEELKAHTDILDLQRRLEQAIYEQGAAQATLASFRGGVGFGGAPAFTEADRRELENYRQTERAMMGPRRRTFTETLSFPWVIERLVGDPAGAGERWVVVGHFPSEQQANDQRISYEGKGQTVRVRRA